MKATIYHNPMCGTSRKTLEILRNEGADVTVIEYLKTPPSKAELKRLYARAGITPREGLRAKEQLASDLDLVDGAVSDDAILEAMARESDPDRAAAGRDRKGRAPVPAAGQGARNPVGCRGIACGRSRSTASRAASAKRRWRSSLAWAAATRSARRTLLWDLDPQAAASFLLGAEPRRRRPRRRRCSPRTSIRPS